MTYPWQCLACGAENLSDTVACAACGCPARATSDDIAAFRPAHSSTPELEAWENARHKRLSAEASAASRYRSWYRASLWAFVCALAIPDGAGLYMLFMGWLAAGYSLAWFANPLLIAALVMARPGADPGAGRGLAYGALAMMFMMPMDGEIGLLVIPFLFWVASAVLLITGMESYRRRYRQALDLPAPQMQVPGKGP